MTEEAEKPLPPFIKRVEPIGTTQQWAHVNHGPNDPRNGFRWVDVPQYPEEMDGPGRVLRMMRKLHGLDLGEAGRALGVGPSVISGLERGGFRSLDDIEVERRYVAMAREPVHLARRTDAEDADKPPAIVCGRDFSATRRWTFQLADVTCLGCSLKPSVTDEKPNEMDGSVTSQRMLKLLRALSDADKVGVPDGLWHGPAHAPVPAESFEAAAAASLPDGEYYVAKTDNVMDAENWGLWRVNITSGVVAVVKDLNGTDKSWHHPPEREAWKLLKALCHDPTSQHPETYVEVHRIRPETPEATERRNRLRSEIVRLLRSPWTKRTDRAYEPKAALIRVPEWALAELAGEFDLPVRGDVCASFYGEEPTFLGVPLEVVRYWSSVAEAEYPGPSRVTAHLPRDPA